MLAQSELIESEKNVNTLSAKFSYVFGVNPKKPEIILDYKQINLDKSQIEKSSQKNNPRLNDIKYQIKSIQNEIEKIKRKRLPRHILMKVILNLIVNEKFYLHLQLLIFHYINLGLLLQKSEKQDLNYCH